MLKNTIFKVINLFGQSVSIITLCSACTVGFNSNKGSYDMQGTTRTSFSEIKWEKLPNGRELSAVKGDIKTEAHIKLVKFAPGMKTAPHTHSYSYVGFVLKGRARHYEPGKPETKTILPAGSYWMILADVVHISECLPGEECIFATNSEGPFDIIPSM